MKTVFITGASGGIGRAAALLFEKNGWNVAAAMRTPEKDTALRGMKNVQCYAMDVLDVPSIEKALASAIGRFGRIDVLVNNAGVYVTKPLEALSEEETRRVIDTNIIGTINMTKCMLPYFREWKAGTIINISSVAGKVTFPYQSVYHCSKWAVEGLSEGLRYELSGLNIRVKTVEPGLVKTGLYDRIQDASAQDCPEEYLDSFRKWQSYLKGNIAKAYGPEVTAKTVYKAATDDSSRLRYASGQDTKTLFFLKAALPLGAFTRIVRRMAGI